MNSADRRLRISAHALVLERKLHRIQAVDRTLQGRFISMFFGWSFGTGGLRPSWCKTRLAEHAELYLRIHDWVEDIVELELLRQDGSCRFFRLELRELEVLVETGEVTLTREAGMMFLPWGILLGAAPKFMPLPPIPC